MRLKLEDIRVQRTLGAAALAGFGVHAAVLFARGEAPHLLWVCHFASICVGAGMLSGRPFIVAIGVLWLCLGNGMWALYLAGGGEFYPTSILTHVVSLAIGLAGMRALGLPRNAWIGASLGLALLVAASRFLTPAQDNVNLAFRVHEGWETLFSSHRQYLAMLGVGAGAIFFAAEKMLRKIFSSSPMG